MEFRGSRPAVCFDLSGASAVIDPVEMEAASYDGSRRVHAVVFPLQAAFAVPVGFLHWGQIGQMICYRLSATVLQDVVPALRSLNDIFITHEKLRDGDGYFAGIGLQGSSELENVASFPIGPDQALGAADSQEQARELERASAAFDVTPSTQVPSEWGIDNASRDCDAMELEDMG